MELRVAGTLGMYRDGSSGKQSPVPLSPLSPAPAFEKYREASGGYGEKVTDRAPLREALALARALKGVCRERCQALLNVICE